MILEEGFASFLQPNDFPTVKIYEIDTTPSGTDGGPPIPQTTMYNEDWHTDAPPKLKRKTDAGCVYAYETEALEDLDDMVNHNQLWKQYWPDGRTCEYWGYLMNHTPSSLSINGRPTINGTIHPTLKDNAGNEVPPVWGQE